MKKTISNLSQLFIITVSLAVIAGCSSSEPKKENPFDTEANTMSVPGGDQVDNPNDNSVTATYSSADLGSSSSGMGR